MSYQALWFDADAETAEDWSDALLEAGALSVDLSDPAAGTADEAPLYGEPGEPIAGRWPMNRITALFSSAADAEAGLAAAGKALNQSPPPYEIYPVAEQDWVRATQAQFAPLRIAEGLWVVPSWCEAPEPGAINLALDPGLAFGTGSHPTTRLCLAWLAQSLRRGESVLDYGCGSGILAIAAVRLGAGEVAGVDVDRQAVDSSTSNASCNEVNAWFGLPEELPAGQTFDVVVANILANPLRLLAPLLASRVRPGGRIVLSGILEPQASAVAAAYAPWFNMDAWGHDEGWVALAGLRRAD